MPLWQVAWHPFEFAAVEMSISHCFATLIDHSLDRSGPTLAVSALLSLARNPMPADVRASSWASPCDSSSDEPIKEDFEEDSRTSFSLVLVWSYDGARIGHALTIVETPRPVVRIFGRGPAHAADKSRLLLSEHRSSFGGAPLDEPLLSRRQLEISYAEHAMCVRNIGERAMLVVDGERVDAAALRPGSIVELDRLFVFLCVNNGRLSSSSSSSSRGGMTRHIPTAFGTADHFGILGESNAIWRVREQIAFLARRREHVLILGPTGTGKELVARAVHEASPRGRRRLVSRNAATIPATLADAELFGNAASYPNVGMAERPGLVGEAEGSTLFLDEIAELPEEVQARLLRIMDDGDYHRLGDARRRKADVRIIGATNRPIEHLRDDVAARFAHVVRLPPLAERRDDIPLLAEHLMRRIVADDLSSEMGGETEPPRLSRRLVTALLRHPFHGNVRELYGILMTAFATTSWGGAKSPRIVDLTREVVLELESRAKSVPPPPASRPPIGQPPPSGQPPLAISREELRAALLRCDGVRERVWRELGLPSRYVLKRLMQRYNLMDD